MKKNAFTLIELAVTAIIIGILVLMGVPNLLKSTQRGYALDAQRNLMALYAAQHSWSESNGGTSFFPCADLATCNTNLDLHIVSAGGTTYSCQTAAVPNTCTAVGAGAFTMVVNLSNAVTINNTPVYCSGLTFNPCCNITAGQTAGSLCP